MARSVAGRIVMPACVICPHISSSFLTPVDNRRPHLSAAATQPFVGLSWRICVFERRAVCDYHIRREQLYEV